MNELLGLTAAIVVGSLTLTAFFLVVSALFPNRVARARAMAEGSPGRSFGVGLINWLFLSALAFTFFVLSENLGLRLFTLPGVMVLAIITIGLIFGLAGLVQLVGERLAPSKGPAARTIWGAVSMTLACATPVVGWFILLPYAAVTALGAFVLSFLYTRPKAEVSPS